MDELEVIERLGVASSLDVQPLVGKEIRSTIKQLNNLEKINEVKMIELKSGRIRKRIYIKNELYDFITNFEE